MTQVGIGGPQPPSGADADERAKLLVGKVVADRYRVMELVAMGGMGAVYRAEHVHMRKQVALKLLRPETEGLPELVQRFEREAVAGAQISHPNVAAASDFGREASGAYYLVLEYIRGVTLSELIKQGPTPAARVGRIGRQIADALSAVHAMGIIHRDIKPRNIMIVEGTEDFVKLIDFGLAKVPVERLSSGEEADNPRRSLTAAGVVMGTIAYMAPEAALGMKAVGPPSDLYALGVVLYELVTGRHPFENVEPTALFAAHRKAIVPAFAVRAPEVEVPYEFERVVRRLLEKEPSARYESAAALVQAIDELFEAGILRHDATPPEPAQAQAVTVAGASSIPPPPTDEVGVKAWLPPPGGFAPPQPPTPQGAPTAPGPVSPPLPSAMPSAEVSLSAFAPRRRRARVAVVIVVGLLALVALALVALQFSRAPAGDTGPPRAATTGAGSPAPLASHASARATAASSAHEAVAPKSSLHAELRAHLGASRWVEALKAVSSMAEREPGTFAETSARDDAAKALLRAPEGEARVLTMRMLAERGGAGGLDALYELARDDQAGGGGPAGKRALELLRRRETLEKASPGLRIAVELRVAPCEQKSQLFARAAREGDARALEILEALRAPDCNPRAGMCCFRKDGLLERAIDEIKARAD